MNLPKSLNLKAAVGLILISVILTASIAYYVFAATPSSTFWIEPGVYPGAPSYTVWRDGSYYYAKDENGHMPAWAGVTNASAIIANAINNLPAYARKISLIGEIILDGYILLDSNMELDLGQSYLKQGRTGSSYTSLIRVQGKENIYIHGGRLDGNKDGGTTNHGIVLESIYTLPYTQTYNVTVENVHLFNVNGTGIVLLNASRCTIKNNYLTDIGNPITTVGPAIRIDDLSAHNLVIGNIIDGTEEHGIKEYATCFNNTVQSNTILNTQKVGISIEAEHSAAIDNYLQNIGLAGSYAAIFASGDFTAVRGNIIVNANYFGIAAYNNTLVEGNLIREATYGIVLDCNCTVTGNQLFDIDSFALQISGFDNNIVGNSVNRASRGIKFLSDADYNIVTGGTYLESTYGIEIDSGCDYNVILGVSTRHCTNGIIDSGSNNHINLCWNITTWIS